MNYSKFDHPGYHIMPPSKKRTPRFMILVAIVLILGILLTLLNLYELHRMRTDHAEHMEGPIVEGSLGNGAFLPGNIVWVNAKNKQRSGYLKHVFNVFTSLGYSFGESNDDWRVLWAHDYPFNNLSEQLKDLKAHQKVNHFPGSGHVTSKVNLAQSSMPFIPKAFRMPKDAAKFKDYSAQHPEMVWVQKNNNHRGIEIKQAKDVDLDKDNSFVQRFVDDPFLIDGYKFDIGVYTILTSINPLRVYTIEDDALFRFCPEKYYPFDQTVRNKYVVHDGYRPMWKVPSLKDNYSSKAFNFKITFNQYMQSQGLNYTKVWTDIRTAIQNVYMEKEKLLIVSSAERGFHKRHNFFEMVRFDFVLDRNLNVYLMEANMSPNLSSKHFPQNKRLYEHVVYTVLKLVGLAEHVDTNSVLHSEDMRVAPCDIRVLPDMCHSPQCNTSCDPIQCQLCRRCVPKDLELILREAYMEHQNRGGARRLLPKPLNATEISHWDFDTELSNIDLNGMSRNNILMNLWFIGKCRMDVSYCV